MQREGLGQSDKDILYFRSVICNRERRLSEYKKTYIIRIVVQLYLEIIANYIVRYRAVLSHEHGRHVPRAPLYMRTPLRRAVKK